MKKGLQRIILDFYYIRLSWLLLYIHIWL
jgi:hypothetical protein